MTVAAGVGLVGLGLLGQALARRLLGARLDVAGFDIDHFAPEGRVAQHLKDVELILDQARRRRQRLPLSEAHLEVLEQCVRRGGGDLDNCSVIAELRRRSG